jgi:hypothetical protein
MRTRATSTVHPPSSIVHRSDERGVALILTLAIITLVTLLVIAFAVSMRVENAASKNFNDLIKTRELAKGAIDQAVATIRQATTRPAALNYVTFPGVIYDYDGATTTRKPLYSQTAVGAPAPDPFDLNDAVNNKMWITGKGGEFPATTASQFPVGWIYVAANGATTAAAGSTLPLNAPLVGRFAFWVDDEASKINLNIAGQVPACVDALGICSDPLDVDLTRLLPNPFVFAADVESGGPYARATYPYTTIEEVKRANAGITPNIFDANRFSTTVYSDDAYYPNYNPADDLDAFGVQRRVTSALTEAIDIKNTPGTNVCLYARLSDNSTLGKIYSGGTFATKYPVVGGVDGLKQLIANVIAYQHDPQNAVDPQAFPPDGGGDPPAYLGLARTPYINEVQVQYTDNGDGTVTRKISVELYYPYSADATYTSGTGGSEDTIVVNGLPSGTPATFSTGPVPITVPANTVFNNSIPKIVFVSELPVAVSPPASITIAPATVVVNYYRNPGVHRLDCAMAALGVNNLTFTIPGFPSVGAAVYHGSEVKDPWVNELVGQWDGYDTGGGGLGNANGNFSPTASILSKAHIRAAPMKSTGELGFIHRPEPGMYLTLQPGGGGGVIPDWAILDSFTVDTAVILKPTMGRININSFINPEATDPTTPRLVPLKALLNSVGLAANAADIYLDDNPAVRSDTFGMKQLTGTPNLNGIFDTIGEVCEVPSLALGANEAAKEAAIRRIANLITVRSSTFTIWVLAQSIKDVDKNGQYNPPPANQDFVAGEVKAQAVVERYENPIGTVKFRTRYFRYLYN